MSIEPAKTVYFVSLGCPKNRVDSEIMVGQVDANGHTVVDSAEEADVIVVNTCGFIEAAKEESIDTILEMAEHKKRDDSKQLIVTGCLTQRYGDEVAADIPEIDLIMGSADYANFSDVLKIEAKAPKNSRRRLPVLSVSDTPTYLYDHTTPRTLTGALHRAYVKIAEGCDRPCAFCIIPKLRGAQRSRTIDSVALEVADLASRGVREINLIAQDLTRYGVDLDDKPTLAALLQRLGHSDGIDWIRLHYTYPSAFSDELIETIATQDRVAKYVDVPLQHIDDDMLKRMRRGHTSRVTHELIQRLRSRVDGLVLRSTFIVGHPGETEDSFKRLCDFVAEAKLDHVGAFTYSKENGTHSATLGDEVAAEVANERQGILMAIQRGVSHKNNLARVGDTVDVLVEGESDESEFILQGRWYGQAPGIDGSVYLTDSNAAVGDLVRAKIIEASDYDLVASADASHWA